MSEMMEVSTSELIGAALDWAVAQAEGVSVKILPVDNPEGKWQVQRGGFNTGPYWPSQDWSQGGPLLEKHQIEVIQNEEGWAAVNGWIYGEIYKMHPRGDTPLIAICRAIAAEKFGDAVNVPKDLMP